jgi:4-amino-4-deoxy-L-arabinose transferase-like glycosyltransferase
VGDPLPHLPESICALLAVYHAVKRTYGKRAGALASLVVCTMPHFFILSHQAITDMPFVSTMTIAMSFLGLAVSEAGEREVRGCAGASGALVAARSSRSRLVGSCRRRRSTS